MSVFSSQIGQPSPFSLGEKRKKKPGEEFPLRALGQPGVQSQIGADIGGPGRAVQAPNFSLNQPVAIQEPVLAEPLVSDPLSLVQPEEADPVNLLDVRRSRKDLSNQLRRDNTQSLAVRQDLNRQRQQAINEGRPEDAAVIMQQIQTIANQGDEGKENLRGLLRLESDLRPDFSLEDRQAGRERLNAQLPAILQDTERQAAEGAQAQQERLSTIGGDLIGLETGLDSSGFTPEARARFALSADPQAVERATFGVGLPPAPGVTGDDVSRIQELIRGGGVDFGVPTDRIEAAPSQIANALTFVQNEQADVQAQQAIRESRRAATVDTEATQAAIIRERAIEADADPFALDGSAEETTESSLVESVFAEQPELTESPEIASLLSRIDSGQFQASFAQAVGERNDLTIDDNINSISQLLNQSGVSDKIRKKIATSILSKIEDIGTPAAGLVESAAFGLSPVLGGAFTAKMATDRAADRLSTGKKIDAFRARLNQIIGQ